MMKNTSIQTRLFTWQMSAMAAVAFSGCNHIQVGPLMARQDGPQGDVQSHMPRHVPSHVQVVEKRINVVKQVAFIDLRQQHSEGERRIQLCMQHAHYWESTLYQHSQQAKALLGAGTGMAVGAGMVVATATQVPFLFQFFPQKSQTKGLQQGMLLSAMGLATLGTSLAAAGAGVGVLGAMELPDEEEYAISLQTQALQMNMASFLDRERFTMASDIRLEQRSFMLADKICQRTPSRTPHNDTEALQELGRWQHELHILELQVSRSLSEMQQREAPPPWLLSNQAGLDEVQLDMEGIPTTVDIPPFSR